MWPLGLISDICFRQTRKHDKMCNTFSPALPLFSSRYHHDASSPPPSVTVRIVYCTSLPCEPSAANMPSSLHPKARDISSPMALLPKPGSQKDIAGEYLTLASADPPGVAALHTRTVSSSSRAGSGSGPSSYSSPSGQNGVSVTQPLHVYHPVFQAPPQRPARSRGFSQSHQKSPNSVAASSSSHRRSPSDSSQQPNYPHNGYKYKTTKPVLITTELRLDVGEIFQNYVLAARTMTLRYVECVRRTCVMFSHALKKKRRALLILPEEVRMSQAVFHAWEGTETWEALFTSHCSKIRAGLREEELQLLFTVAHILLEETWRAMGALLDVCYEHLVMYSRDAENYAYLSGAPTQLGEHPQEHQEIIANINSIFDRPSTSTADPAQQTFIQSLLKRLRGLILHRKNSKSKQCTEGEDEDFELIENFNLCSISSNPSPESFMHRRTASDIVLDSLDTSENTHVMELNLSLRASRIVFSNVTSTFKNTPYRRPEHRADIIRDERGIVVFCTVTELIRRLTDRFEVRDVDTLALMDAFFMFFREFMRPEELVYHLKSRYKETPSSHIHLESRKEEQINNWNRYQTTVKIHVVRMFTTWLDRYYLPAHDSLALKSIHKFAIAIAHDQHLPDCAVELLQTHLQICMEGKKDQQHTSVFQKIVAISEGNSHEFKPTAFRSCLPIMEAALEKSGALPDILAFYKPDGAEELARAFTAIESEIFHRCLPLDLMRCTEKDSHPVFDKMQRWSQAINLFVSQSILERREMQARAHVFELLIEVAVACHNLRNYSSAMSLFLALESTRITRLKEMIEELVSERHQAMLNGIKDFFDFRGSKQWQNYRDDLRFHHGPAVPLLVSVKSDILKIKAARRIARQKYEPQCELKNASGEFIDIQMYKRLKEIVRELESCYAPYKLPSRSFVISWLKSSLEPFEYKDYAEYDDKYTEMSEKIQPPRMHRGSWNQDELWALGSWD
ncbi:ras guanine nucleotide exchange factor domain-containing protein [Irpex rosettiformis]|uniref:Ras guanine nucleotide exchange factor domain-containing protein n=1 Tax=Irpex rosettiformis TaxID=378272 RepID=A0ACB8U0Z7_9APHY|nr:ras guanine nucleotide exchange factor domain-containing protein [Irpex rosettiformis]